MATSSRGEMTARSHVRRFLRELNAASVCIAELLAALGATDRARATTAIVSLHRAWILAEAAIFALEACTGHDRSESFAYAALRASYELGAQPLARALLLILEPPPDPDDPCGGASGSISRSDGDPG
jgi:hypothetical protein